MQKWQHEWLNVARTANGLTATVGVEQLDHQGVSEYIRKLGEEGWEMVSAAPTMQSRVETNYIGSGPVAYAIPETSGYSLWFKRPVE